MPAASGPWHTAQRPAKTLAPDTGWSATAGSAKPSAASATNGTRATHAENVFFGRREATALLLINRNTQDDGRGAGIRLALRTETPRDLVVVLRPHHRPIALIILTSTSPPGHSAAAVIVRNDVISLIRRIPAGADPGDRRHFRARRTGIDAAAVTCAQRPVDGAVAPIIAFRRITGILRITRDLRRRLARRGVRRG